MKSLEDILLYRKLSNWQEINDSFSIIPEEALSFGISKNDITEWYQLVQEYISRQPNLSSVRTFGLRFNLEPDSVDLIIEELKKIQTNQKIITLIDKLYTDFETLVD